ncbi:MAG: arginine decarboxylase [Bacteroidetes bacterium]|jgi:arginine decarboxylase|nr:arginine decarboxylase [Bacteroidota bacterium]
MKNTYFDLIDQSYYFPQEGFDIKNGYLTFYGLSLQYLIEKHGTPFRLMYLPRIEDQIKRVKNLFNRAIKKTGYEGSYNYCYCTKCNHFAPVVKTALKQGVNLETSSSYDIDLILQLLAEGDVEKDIKLVHNGYKTDSYLDKIIQLHEIGFTNSITVLDSMTELQRIRDRMKKRKLTTKIKLGIRMAINEEPQSAYYTSRLGISPDKILDFYKTELAKDKNVELLMLHFFIDSGIKDNLYYWGEFQKGMKLYAELKKVCKSLNAINFGGGFPIRNNLGFDYDYEDMIKQIVKNLKSVCDEEDIDHPDIYTEFGKYTVGESGAIIFSVIEQKQQNDAELWYMVDNSLMNTIPDAWSILEKFILLPINKWDNEYTRVNIGGISCDHSDYYNSEDMNQEVHLPRYSSKDKEPLYIGFFHTGAYQDSISGYGGIKHCLIPSPKYILVDRDEKGNYYDTVYSEEQKVDHMLKILGYDTEKERIIQESQKAATKKARVK